MSANQKQPTRTGLAKFSSRSAGFHATAKEHVNRLEPSKSSKSKSTSSEEEEEDGKYEEEEEEEEFEEEEFEELLEGVRREEQKSRVRDQNPSEVPQSRVQESVEL